MKNKPVQIKNSSWLELEENGRLLHGYDQDWFSSDYRRTRGCGPTAAAMQINYLTKKEGLDLPFSGESIVEAKLAMEFLWDYFTPDPLLGLYGTDLYCLGGARLIRDYRLDWTIRRLKVQAFKKKRPPLASVVRFIQVGLLADCPVAFLNLHKGACDELDSWHWIIITGLTFDEAANKYYASCFDNGVSKNFDLGLWLATSKLGGGFVYVGSDNNTQNKSL